jgi:hypothetical protein
VQSFVAKFPEEFEKHAQGKATTAKSGGEQSHESAKKLEAA